MKKAIFTMGLPGAGKSTVLNQVYPGIQNIDPDAVKESHPDYDPKNPGALHVWSKAITKAQFAKALTEENDFALDGTGTSPVTMIQKIEQAQANGFHTILLFVKVPVKVAVERNANRPRVVPEYIIHEKAEIMAKSFEIVSEYADEVKVVNNG